MTRNSAVRPAGCAGGCCRPWCCVRGGSRRHWSARLAAARKSHERTGSAKPAPVADLAGQVQRQGGSRCGRRQDGGWRRRTAPGHTRPQGRPRPRPIASRGSGARPGSARRWWPTLARRSVGWTGWRPWTRRRSTSSSSAIRPAPPWTLCCMRWCATWSLTTPTPGSATPGSTMSSTRPTRTLQRGLPAGCGWRSAWRLRSTSSAMPSWVRLLCRDWVSCEVGWPGGWWVRIVFPVRM
jgi:hypothetical protein